MLVWLRVLIVKLPSVSSSWRCRSTVGQIFIFCHAPNCNHSTDFLFVLNGEAACTNIRWQSIGRRSRNECSSTALLSFLILHFGRQLETMPTMVFAHHKIQIEMTASLVVQCPPSNPCQQCQRSLMCLLPTLLLLQTCDHRGGQMRTTLP
jgi:hypothetical protein